MNTTENVNLVLKTYALTTTETQYGICNGSNTILQFKNLNLRSIMGSMYDKYDTFNLVLNSVMICNTTTAMSANYGNNDQENFTTLLTITGLPFINQTYNCCTQTNTSTAFLCPLLFSVAAKSPTITNFYSSVGLMFGKSQDIANITLSLIRSSDTKPVVSTNAFPEQSYFFSIYGIPRDDGNKNSTRMLH